MKECKKTCKICNIEYFCFENTSKGVGFSKNDGTLTRCCSKECARTGAILLALAEIDASLYRNAEAIDSIRSDMTYINSELACIADNIRRK